jgi:predicted ATPase/DNA-binding XRE family transcriptional regulator
VQAVAVGCWREPGGFAEGEGPVAELPAVSFAGLLRQLRSEARLTQEELAEAASLSPRTVSDLERGLSRTARKDSALMLADALALTGPERALFMAAARGLAPAAELLAARDAAAALNNLPAQLTTFIGRDRELGEVRALVESSRLVTLTGAGGAGKTRLALQVAAELLEGTGDGVWLVELAAVSDGEAVVPAIAAAMRHAPQRGRPVLETLLGALAPQDVVIVLDNCEHLISACSINAEAILRRCPKVRLMVTSREPLGIGGETIYRVPSLSLPGTGDGESGAAAAGSSDAVTLFVDRGRAQGIALSLDKQTIGLVVSVCRRLDGMPLAIELAAARLRTMSLAELRDRLDQRFRLLTGGSRTALERQQSLRAAVGWSYSLLTGTERQLLGRLSVFVGGFGLDGAEAVCGFGGIGVLEIADLLGSLVDKSMVVAEPAGEALRYRLLETIRLFAAERLIEAGDGEAAAVAAAHFAHFLAVSEAAAVELTGPRQGGWLNRLDADQANLLRAGGHAASDPEGTALVLRLGVALHRYWTVRSRQADAFGLLVPVIRRPDARADPALFASALVTAAWAAAFTDITSARHFAEEAVQLARRLRDDRLLIASLAALCGAYFFAGEPQAGLPFGRESVERARQLGDDVLLGESLFFYLLTVGPARSGRLMSEAIGCTERSGDQLINASLHNSAAIDAVMAGDVRAARVHLEAAAQAAQAIGQQRHDGLAILGVLLRAEGEPDSARSAFEEALRVSRRNGSNLGMAGACLGLACLAADGRDWYSAAALHGIAQAFQDRSSNPWQEFDARYRRDSLTQVRAHLGHQQLERAYAQGMALGVDEATGLALRGAVSASSPPSSIPESQ